MNHDALSRCALCLLLPTDEGQTSQTHALIIVLLQDRSRLVFFVLQLTVFTPTLYLQQHSYDQHVLSKHDRPRVDSNSAISRRLFHTMMVYRKSWQ